MTVHCPSSLNQITEIVRAAAADRSTIEIEGAGTRKGLGRPVQAPTNISMLAHSGITLYEPAELVMSARAGTPLLDIKRELDARGQMLAFEPADYRGIYGSAGTPTIGGVFATNTSGPRRLISGAARDHLLGATVVNGRGQTIRTGGRVMKNVTGLDLSKLMCGAFGTLGVLSEVTFKVLPRPSTNATLVIEATNPQEAVVLMTRAMNSPFEISGAAYWRTKVFLRIEGFSDSVEYRLNALVSWLKRSGEIERDRASEVVWQSIRDLADLETSLDAELWKVSVAPSKAPLVLSALPADLSVLLDWSGGLLWISGGDEFLDHPLREKVGALGGHATLIRASAQRRSSASVFHPVSTTLDRLTRGLKESFDPMGIFNPGRMYEGV